MAKVFGRQVAKVSAKQISPLRYDSANTACFGKYACEVSNTVKCTLHVAMLQRKCSKSQDHTARCLSCACSMAIRMLHLQI